jgi:hypothetical protein
MISDFGKFWAWLGAGTMAAFGFLTIGLVLKDQEGAVNVLNASTTGAANLVGAFGKIGS